MANYSVPFLELYGARWWVQNWQNDDWGTKNPELIAEAVREVAPAKDESSESFHKFASWVWQLPADKCRAIARGLIAGDVPADGAVWTMRAMSEVQQQELIRLFQRAGILARIREEPSRYPPNDRPWDVLVG